MALGRLLKTAIKFAPIAYPIIRKVINKKKASNAGQYKTPDSKR